MREALWHKHYCISSAYIIITIFILYEVACYFCHLFKVPFYMMCTYRCGYFVLRVAGTGGLFLTQLPCNMQHANKINMITMRSVALLIFSRSSHSFIINQTRHHRSIFTPPILPPLCFTHKMSTQKDATTDAVSLISPPMAKREEDRVVFAGIAPPGWDSKMPRQSNDSSGEYT